VSVAQQLQIWEESMKGFTERRSILIQFDGAQVDTFSEFMRYAKQHKLKYTKFTNNRNSVVWAVVDEDQADRVYQFYNDHQIQ